MSVALCFLGLSVVNCSSVGGLETTGRGPGEDEPVYSGDGDGDGDQLMGMGGQPEDECSRFHDRAMPKKFEACGGEPFGTWRSTQVEWETWDISSRASGPQVLLEGGYRFRFNEGGRATVFREEARLEAMWDARCEDLDSGAIVIDFDPEIPEYRRDCYSVSCGCLCELDFEEVLTSAAWSRTSNAMEITLYDYNPQQFDYCIDGDVMTLQNTDGRTITLERVFETFTPTSCEGRAEEKCVGGCTWGKCSGGDDCEGRQSESSCLSFSGCSWKQDECSGQADAHCGLDDFEVSPSCSFATSASCQGTPDPCWQIDESSCEEQVGCVAERWCGGGTFNCSGGDWDNCSYIEGCVYGGGVCSGGVVDCVDQGEFCNFDAEIVGGCDVYDCSGTPTSCEELDLPTCNQVQGCSLVGE